MLYSRYHHYIVASFCSSLIIPLLLAMHYAEPTAPLSSSAHYPRHGNNPYCIKNKCFNPDTNLKSYQARGIASWYGKPFHGRSTSAGEIFNMYAYTAASTELPIPSYAKVTNTQNNKSVIVRINDRGPFVAGRLLDLSYGAAHKLGFTDSGITEVNVEWIHPAHYEKMKLQKAALLLSQ